MVLNSTKTGSLARNPQNTVQDILDLVRELSVPPLKMYVRYTVLVQKGNKDIKVVHVTSVG